MCTCTPFSPAGSQIYSIALVYDNLVIYVVITTGNCDIDQSYEFQHTKNQESLQAVPLYCLDTTQPQTNDILKDDASSTSSKEAPPKCSKNTVVIVNDHFKDEATDNI